MVSYVTNWTQPANKRWIKPVHWYDTVGSTAATAAGRVRAIWFEVTEPQIVDGIAIYNVATVAGNVRVAIYGRVTTEETPVGAPLVVESASVACAGANTIQVIPITATQLAPGRYYVAAQYDDVTHTFGSMIRTAGGVPFVNAAAYFDQVYGAFTNPFPAIGGTLSTLPVYTIRVYKA